MDKPKEYLVSVAQYGFAIVEADSLEKAREYIEDNPNDLNWADDIEITSVDENEKRCDVCGHVIEYNQCQCTRDQHAIDNQ